MIKMLYLHNAIHAFINIEDPIYLPSLYLTQTLRDILIPTYCEDGPL